MLPMYVKTARSLTQMDWIFRARFADYPDNSRKNVHF